MSEQMQPIAEEAIIEQQEAAEIPAQESGEEGGEMPREERAKNAARRRAAEQQANAIRADAREQQLRMEVMNHPLVREAMTLLEETRFNEDLAKVRSAYPSLEANRPEEVGEIYCRLMASGAVDPITAYEAQIAADRRRNPVPDDMVSAKTAGGAALYYSSGELDRLTDADLRDPGIFKKAMASLSKLRR